MGFPQIAQMLAENDQRDKKTWAELLFHNDNEEHYSEMQIISNCFPQISQMLAENDQRKSA